MTTTSLVMETAIMARSYRLMLVVLTLGLMSCVDTQNVSTFANSVTVVTSATTKMIDSDRTVCANINAVLDEFGKLSKIGPFGPEAYADCSTLGKVLDAINGVNTVLENYGKALGNISQDTVVNYDSDVTALQGILKSLPAKYQPTAAQSTAVSELAGWVASLVTERSREKAIRNAMSGPGDVMNTHFHTVVALLRQLSSQYSETLTTSASTTAKSLDLVTRVYSGSEPVAVAELRNRLAGASQVGAGATDAISQYAKALDAMDTAFDAARKEPTAKELLTEVRSFAQQARSVYESFAKAFPNG
jgi:hypothetical protein